ncbi:putative hydrophobin precursor [Exophiala viscosa]|uniref:Hydrophobin n=1 Tax=Exophiala viscosa TaxID=2486360 RepID=A0AAN6ICE2_9EURO|nr:putative hydrophobin precursor [Exophiala viscosa]
MHFSTIVIALAGASTALALPALMERQASLCTGDYSEQCCATDVLGLADLNCAAPPTVPANATDFTNICSAIGQQAQCCLLPILEQGLICTTPV